MVKKKWVGKYQRIMGVRAWETKQSCFVLIAHVLMAKRLGDETILFRPHCPKRVFSNTRPIEFVLHRVLESTRYGQRGGSG